MQPGYVYLLHFYSPLGTPGNPRAQARHYIGWALDINERLAQHRTGRGAAITRAAVQAGISFDLVEWWPGDRHLEAQIKRRKEHPRLCPICGVKHRKGHLCLDWQQLPLFDDPWPAPARPPRIDWYEISMRRQWSAARAARACAGFVAPVTVEGEIPW